MIYIFVGGIMLHIKTGLAFFLETLRKPGKLVILGKLRKFIVGLKKIVQYHVC